MNLVTEDVETMRLAVKSSIRTGLLEGTVDPKDPRQVDPHARDNSHKRQDKLCNNVSRKRSSSNLSVK